MRPELYEELRTFMGALLYPELMKELSKGNELAKRLIDYQ
jgi:hypothetical protein